MVDMRRGPWIVVALLAAAIARAAVLQEGVAGPGAAGQFDAAGCATLEAGDGADAAEGAQAVDAVEAASADTAALRLRLNIPAFRLDVVRRGVVVTAFPVAVGTARYPTPTGRYVVDEVTWNPRWVPPPSDWARDEAPMEPGPSNPMGRVKLRFAPSYYLHGTPFERSIGGVGSHGCVRLRNADAIELGRLVQREGLPSAGDAAVDEWLADGRRTRVVPLARVVPFESVYAPVEVRSDSLLVHRDVYRRLRRSILDEARAVLQAAGYGGRIDHERLAAVLDAAGSSAIAVPLRSVLRRPPDAGGGFSMDRGPAVVVRVVA